MVSPVPLLDMLRYHHFLMARYWVPEYGSSEDREQFDLLLRYSPYQNVEDGVRYPAVLLTAGENDSRVHALHARKMAARLQAATASDPAQRPILLWVEREAGHGYGKPLALRVRDAADMFGFLAWQLGLGGGVEIARCFHNHPVRTRRKGADPPPLRHEATSLTDPAGYSLCFQWPRSRSSAGNRAGHERPPDQGGWHCSVGETQAWPSTRALHR